MFKVLLQFWAIHFPYRLFWWMEGYLGLHEQNIADFPVRRLEQAERQAWGPLFFPTRSFPHPQMPKQSGLSFDKATVDRLDRNRFSFFFSVSVERDWGYFQTAFLTGPCTPCRQFSFLEWRPVLFFIFIFFKSRSSSPPQLPKWRKEREVCCLEVSLKVNNQF